ncbi:MAG: cupin domain-containing protein [Candidatus Omnitrophica bacterium]|nr:cupin domain-containing protein [Candidatus Omnitrophota bacterium]
MIIRSTRRAGRLIPSRPRGLRSRVVTLRPGEAMAWHSTQRREELILLLEGTLQVELARPSRRRRLRAGQCAFLPPRTTHRLVNHTKHTVRYVYVTGS